MKIEDQVIFVLNSLPDSFEILVTPIENSEIVPDIDTVNEKLRYIFKTMALFPLQFL